MKKTAIAAIAFALGTGGVAAMEAAPAAGLVAVEDAEFTQTWVNPDVDFRQYDKIVVARDGAMEFREAGLAKAGKAHPLKAHALDFSVSDVDRARFDQVAGDAFKINLMRSERFEVVDEVGPNTLVVRGHMVDAVSKAGPPVPGANTSHSNAIGNATLILEVIDPVKGETIAYATERSRIHKSGNRQVESAMSDSAMRGWKDVRRWAGNAGVRLASGLDSTHEI